MRLLKFASMRDPMEKLNLYAAWLAILAGFISGSIQGLFFHKEDFLGGYASWTRRMLRLGHISFFGTAFVNLAFVSTASYAGSHKEAIMLTATAFLLGLVTMPLVCYLSAFDKAFRYLFVIPVASFLTGAAVFILGGLLR